MIMEKLFLQTDYLFNINKLKTLRFTSRISILILSLFYCLQGVAQTTPAWQWIKPGGGTSAGNTPESIKGLGTDSRGNLYGVSSGSYNNMLDTFSGNNSNLVLPFIFSTRCDGSMRWAKNLSVNLDMDINHMVVDTLGNMYIAGSLGSSNSVYDFLDTTLSGFNNNYIIREFIAKIDSNGQRKFLQFYGTNAMNGLQPFVPKISQMQMFSNGKIGALVFIDEFYQMNAWAGFPISGVGFYILQINPNTGTALSLTKLGLQMNTTAATGVTFAEQFGSYYVTYFVVDTLTIGPQTYTYNQSVVENISGIAKFGSNGSYIWNQHFVQTTSPSSNSEQTLINPFIKVFKDKVIFLGDFVGFPLNGNTFLGHSFLNPLANQHAGFIAAIDTLNATYKWCNPVYSSDYNDVSGLTINQTNQSVLFGGRYGADDITYIIPSDTIKPLLSNTPNRVHRYVANLDANTGSYNWASGANTNGFYELTNFITTYKNNTFVSGPLTDSIYDGNGIGYRSPGSGFFISKVAISQNCNCTLAQTFPQFVNINNNSITVKGYASSAVDSLYWIWGDGGQEKYSSQNTNVSHTYLTGGNKIICLRSFTSCGILDSCIEIKALSSNSIQVNQPSLSPNPTSDFIILNIPESASTLLTIYSINGVKCSNFSWSPSQNKLDVSKLPNGMYFLNIQFKNRESSVLKFTKE